MLAACGGSATRANAVEGRDALIERAIAISFRNAAQDRTAVPHYGRVSPADRESCENTIVYAALSYSIYNFDYELRQYSPTNGRYNKEMRQFKVQDGRSYKTVNFPAWISQMGLDDNHVGGIGGSGYCNYDGAVIDKQIEEKNRDLYIYYFHTQLKIASSDSDFFDIAQRYKNYNLYTSPDNWKKFSCAIFSQPKNSDRYSYTLAIYLESEDDRAGKPTLPLLACAARAYLAAIGFTAAVDAPGDRLLAKDVEFLAPVSPNNFDSPYMRATRGPLKWRCEQWQMLRNAPLYSMILSLPKHNAWVSKEFRPDAEGYTRQELREALIAAPRIDFGANAADLALRAKGREQKCSKIAHPIPIPEGEGTIVPVADTGRN